jgi:hypothetical protein
MEKPASFSRVYTIAIVTGFAKMETVFVKKNEETAIAVLVCVNMETVLTKNVFVNTADLESFVKLVAVGLVIMESAKPLFVYAKKGSKALTAAFVTLFSDAPGAQLTKTAIQGLVY